MTLADEILQVLAADGGALGTDAIWQRCTHARSKDVVTDQLRALRQRGRVSRARSRVGVTWRLLDDSVVPATQATPTPPAATPVKSPTKAQRQRTAVLAAITETPGIAARDLRQRLDMNADQVCVAIRALREEGLVVYRGNTSQRRFYPPNSIPAPKPAMRWPNDGGLGDRLGAADRALGLVRDELARACARFPAFHSTHEGFGVLLEEVHELWDEVRHDHRARALEEAVQVAAMAVRFITDCGAERA